MTNGYKILWTDFALNELEDTIEYLNENSTERELRSLAKAIEETLTYFLTTPIYFKHLILKKKFAELL